MFGRAAQDDVDLRHLTERVDRLEALVAQLEARLAQPAPAAGEPAASPPAAEAAFMAEVREFKARGKLINAIKVYRENTGVSLKEAKEYVERMV